MTSRSRICWLSVCAAVGLSLAGAPSCTSAPGDCVTKTGNPGNRCAPSTPPVARTLAEQCGLDIDCEGPGLSRGHAFISGERSTDSYFASVLRFQSEAHALSSTLDREIAALRVLFGVAADADLGVELRARIAAATDGGLRVRTDAPRCEIMNGAVLTAHQRCEGEAGESSEVECHGRCEQPAGAEVACGETAQLACTFLAAASRCAGECRGLCATELSMPAECDGVCRGSCSGVCSLFSDAGGTECAGRCDGVCTGSCEVEQLEGAPCEGLCGGDCTIASEDGCDGARSASCQAAPGSFVRCTGRCEGEVGLPMARAECDAVVRAEAKMSQQCALPRVSIDYQLEADLDPAERERFEFAMRTLQRRLPLLIMTLARAEGTLSAGTDLVDDVPLLKATLLDQISRGDHGLRELIGLHCAAREAMGIPAIVESGADRLWESIADAISITRELGLE